MSNPTMWMPLYIGDYLANTMHLSAEEHGAYLLLIMHYWQHGPIKNDQKTIKNIAKISFKKCDRILQFFEEKDGYLIHTRIEDEKAKAIELKEKQRKRTEAATAARHTKDPSVTEDVTLSVTESPSPSPSPSATQEDKSSFAAQPRARDDDLTSGDAVPHAAPPETITPFQRVYDAGVAVLPQLASASTSAIHSWIADGCDPDLDIIPEIQRIAREKPTIRGWRFFTGAITDAKATRTTPLPQGTAHGFHKQEISPPINTPEGDTMKANNLRKLREDLQQAEARGDKRKLSLLSQTFPEESRKWLENYERGASA